MTNEENDGQHGPDLPGYVESGDNQSSTQLKDILRLLHGAIAACLSFGLWGILVCVFRTLLAACLVLLQVGCTADILPWPGFESQPGIFSYPEQIPAVEVAEQVRCELADFLRDEQRKQDPKKGDPQEGPRFFDFNKGAQVQLKLTTDLQGSVTYLGINLNGLGLGAIASLVTPASNVPSLQLKAQGKNTQTSQVDFIIPQTTDDVIYRSPPASTSPTVVDLGKTIDKLGKTVAGLKTVPEIKTVPGLTATLELGNTVTELDKTVTALGDAVAGLKLEGTDLQKAVIELKAAVVDLKKATELNTITELGNGVTKLGERVTNLGKNVDELPPKPISVRLPDTLQLLTTQQRKSLPKESTACPYKGLKQIVEYKWFRLWLSKALQAYKERLEVQESDNLPHKTFFDGVCQPKLTIATQFQLLFDISAGSNILHAVPIILPVSGLNIDASPDYTHFIQIIFSLRPYGQYDKTGLNPTDDQTRKRIKACEALQATNPPASVR